MHNNIKIQNTKEDLTIGAFQTSNMIGDRYMYFVTKFKAFINRRFYLNSKAIFQYLIVNIILPFFFAC